MLVKTPQIDLSPNIRVIRFPNTPRINDDRGLLDRHQVGGQGVRENSLGHKLDRGGTSPERTTPDVYTLGQFGAC